MHSSILWTSSSMSMSLRRTMKSTCASKIRRAWSERDSSAFILLKWFRITFDRGRIPGNHSKGCTPGYVC